MVEYMNELLTSSLPRADSTAESTPPAVPTPGDALEPLGRLEARICELAGHLTAGVRGGPLVLCQGARPDQDRHPETEAGLVSMATPMTAGQLERFAQAHRQVSQADRTRPPPARKLTWSPAGDLDYQFRAIRPAEAAAVVFQALRAARNDLEHPHDDHDHIVMVPAKAGSSETKSTACTTRTPGTMSMKRASTMSESAVALPGAAEASV